MADLTARSFDLGDMMSQTQQAQSGSTDIQNHYLSAQEEALVADSNTLIAQNASGTSYLVGDATAKVGFCVVY